MCPSDLVVADGTNRHQLRRAVWPPRYGQLHKREVARETSRFDPRLARYSPRGRWKLQVQVRYKMKQSLPGAVGIMLQLMRLETVSTARNRQFQSSAGLDVNDEVV